MDRESEVDELLVQARAHGLPENREGPFLLWLGNEVYEGREMTSIPVLMARARELVLMFRKQDRQSAER